MSKLIDQSLGRYHILEQLGEGGMATVYKAYDTRLETDVAVKVIRAERLTEETKEHSIKRFEREAKSLARLTHSNIVKVMDYGEYEGKPFLVMPYLPAGTLKSKLAGRPMPWDEALRLLMPIADALAYAHKHDIVHRDIKPSNILITENGQPMLTDFGVAKLLDIEETMELTGTGVGVGTPEYMAPEQVTSKSVDARVDIYALGVVLYEMLTGRKPYTADTPMAVLFKHASEPLPRPKQHAPDLPQRVENVLLKALAKNPDNRYQNMTAFLAALNELLKTQAPGEKRSRLEIRSITAEKSREKSTGLIPPSISRRTVLIAALIMVGVVGLLAAPWLVGPLSAGTSATGTPGITSTPIVTPTSASPAEIMDDSGASMRLVPAGQFLMGSDEGEVDEQPSHSVYLDAYYIDTYEVTNAQYERCVRAGKCVPPTKTRSASYNAYYGNAPFDNYPIVYVDWSMAKAYCRWRGAALPTEAQWEKATRGTDGRIYPWGDEFDCHKGNFDDEQTVNAFTVPGGPNCDGYGGPSRVGSFESGISPYGVHDLAGNVSEWVADWYQEDYYSTLAEGAFNPVGPENQPGSEPDRVLRGDSWTSASSNLPLSAMREGSDPDSASDFVGFRCADSVP